MTHYSGICSGGPHDGKPLHHPENRFELVIRGFRAQAYQPGYKLGDGEERGTYIHAIDRWEWIREK